MPHRRPTSLGPGGAARRRGAGAAKPMGASKSRDATATSSGESILSDEGPASDRGIGRSGPPSRGAQSRSDASAGVTRMQAAPEHRQVNAWPQSVQILADVDADERNVQPPPELEEEWSATDNGGFVPESPGPACAKLVPPARPQASKVGALPGARHGECR